MARRKESSMSTADSKRSTSDRVVNGPRQEDEKWDRMVNGPRQEDEKSDRLVNGPRDEDEDREHAA